MPFKPSRKKQETQNEEEMRKRTEAKERIENIKSPQGKAAKLSLLPMSVLQVATQMWRLTPCYLVH